MKTFKDQLTAKADVFNIDISEHITKIKQKIEQIVTRRSFTVGLIAAKAHATIAFGNNDESCYQTFIPRNIEPDIYVKRFTAAFKELGFSLSNGALSLGISGYKDYDIYNITLRW